MEVCTLLIGIMCLFISLDLSSIGNRLENITKELKKMNERRNNEK